MSSTGNNQYQILFSDGNYHVLKSSQISRAPNDVTIDTNLPSGSSKDLDTLYEVAANDDDASVLDNVITNSNFLSSYDYDPVLNSIEEEVPEEEMNHEV